jgi:uncharacterized membrane protein
MSLVVQKQGGAGQGNASPTLYGLLKASANPFHATPSGNNSVPGVNGFTASGASYNLATGLGSVDAHVLASSWGAVAAIQGFSITPSVTVASILAGKSASFTVAVAGIGGFTGPVNLTATAPAGVTVTFSPASVKAGSSATATISVASGAAIGSGKTITLTGVSGSISKTAKLSLAVLAPPALSLSTAASSVSVTQGKSVTLAITAVTGGTYAGPVSLTVTGMPAGVTATFNKSSFTPSSAVSSTGVTLTVQAGSAAALNPAALQISASGDGLTAQTVVTVHVTAAPAIELALSQAAATMAPGKGATVTAILSTQGISTEPVHFYLGSLPKGVTAKWSVNPVTPDAKSGSASAVLNITASSTAPASSGTLTITATGGGVTTQQNLTLSVAAGSSNAAQEQR